MDENSIQEPVWTEETEPEDKLAPFRAAREQRESSAAILAEHDAMIADMLFEMTIKEMEES